MIQILKETVMLLYGIIIFTGIQLSIILTLLNHPSSNFLAGDLAIWLIISIFICGLSSGVICIITRILPKSVFDPHRRRYKTFGFEVGLYRILRVKRWKGIIPDLGKLSGLEKSKLTEPNNPDYMKKFLQENCIAESLHFFSMVSGLLVFIFIPAKFFWSVGMIIFLTNTILHVMPVFVQRYLRPKMVKVYDRLIEKQKLASEFELKNEDEIVKV